jgi:hypothetical protein
MSDPQQSSQAPGQSAPGAGAASGGSPVEPEVPDGQSPPAGLVDYTDSRYQFRVAYPADFVLRTLPAEQLAPFDPRPAAVFRFINPTIAASDLGDLEPPDLEVRVYPVAEVASLEEWLTANKLLPVGGGGDFQPFQTPHVSGVKGCSATMIAPGCFFFVLGPGWVYQLTPATLAGEGLIETFALTNN